MTKCLSSWSVVSFLYMRRMTVVVNLSRLFPLNDRGRDMQQVDQSEGLGSFPGIYKICDVVECR